MTALAERLEREGRALSQRVLEEMYRDAFWTERFGDKGRRHADEDSDFHLRYLARALTAGDGAILVRYATWLREVLATRGMCTRHLDENFRLLAAQIERVGWPGRDTALALLEEARASLLHADARARWVQQHAPAIAQEVTRSVAAAHPQGWKRGDRRGEAGLADDAANYLSYLADALAFGDPRTLLDHARWFVAHLARHHVAAPAIAAFMDACRAALEARGAPQDVVGYLRQCAQGSTLAA